VNITTWLLWYSKDVGGCFMYQKN